MTVAALALLAFTACSSVSGEASGDRTERRVVDVQGEQRSYLAHAPEGVNAQGAPMILVFHGAGGNAESMLLGTDVYRVARELGAVLAVPDADHMNWAEDCGCTNADIVHGTADTAFVSTMMADLGAAWGSDASRAWVVGFSQGGMFAQRLGCQMADRFQAIAVIAATISVPLAERCDPSRPVSVFTALSVTDPIFPWDGLEDGALSTLGGPATGALWQERNGCDAEPTSVQESGGTRWVWSGCDGGVRLELMGVDPGAHAWYMSSRVDTAIEVARFFGG